MAQRGLDEAFRHRLFVTTPARVLAMHTTTPSTHAAS
jgi:hypothetical protein